MRLAGATALLILLAGCSSAPPIDAAGWTPSDPDLTEVDCGELLDQWRTVAAEGPEACWTFESSTGVQDRFAAMMDDFADHAGAEPATEAGCETSSDIDVDATSCWAEWESADGAVFLSTNLTLDGLDAEREAGTEVDATTTRLYEVTLWVADESSADE